MGPEEVLIPAKKKRACAKAEKNEIEKEKRKESKISQT